MKKILIIVSIIFFSIIGVVLIKFIIPEIKYSQEIEWLDNISNGSNLIDAEYSKHLTYFEDNLTYKKNDTNLKKLKYIKAQKLLNEDHLDEAMELYQELDNYENSIQKIEEINNLKKENNYKDAINEYTNGNFQLSKEKFNLLEGAYKEKDEYLEKIEKVSSIQGNYESGVMFITINKWNIIYGVNPKYEHSYQKKSKFTLEDNKIKYKELLGDTYEWEKELVVDFDNRKIVDPISTGEYVYVSDSTDVPTGKKQPKVGMTADEVKNSTWWGKPNKVNKSTYSWGTSEQWVYNDRGYIYFKNGIVTSISEK